MLNPKLMSLHSLSFGGVGTFFGFFMAEEKRFFLSMFF